MQSKSIRPRALRSAVEAVADSRSAIDGQIADKLLSTFTHGIVDAFSRHLDMQNGLFHRQSLLRQIEVQRQIADATTPGPIVQVHVCLVSCKVGQRRQWVTSCR